MRVIPRGDRDPYPKHIFEAESQGLRDAGGVRFKPSVKEPWGLFHVHSGDGRRVAFEFQKPMERWEAEAEAQGLNVGRGRAGAADLWRVEAGKL